MGCFLACFGSSKDRKRSKHASTLSPPRPNVGSQYRPHTQLDFSIKQSDVEKPISLVPQSGSVPEEETLSLISRDEHKDELSPETKRKVTFDSNVMIHQNGSIDEAPRVLLDYDKGIERGNDASRTKTSQSASVSENSSTLSSLGSYPSSHRYQNCVESDDEDDGLAYEDSDVDDNSGNDGDEEEDYDYDEAEYPLKNVSQELSSGSFSSTESRTKSSNPRVDKNGLDDPTMYCGPLDREKNTTLFNCNARDRSGYVHSVLNPVENTNQWKAVKAKATPILKQQKENFVVSHEVPKRSFDKDHELKDNRDVAVDASLSTWLVSSQATPTKASPLGSESHGSNSLYSPEERPILGALTIEELKRFSATNSPRSPCQNVDEKPVIGTVGTHWKDRVLVEDSGSASSFKGIPNTTSKYREDKKVNWHSTPFVTRLERALNQGAA